MSKLPDGWTSDELNNCIDRIIDYRGKSVPKAEFGVRLITARNVRNGSLNWEYAEYIPKDIYDSWMDRGIPRSGDILFTTEAPLGMVAHFPQSGRYALGQRLVAIRTDEKRLVSTFLLQFLISQNGQDVVFQRSSGSTAIGIKQRELRKIRIPLPPLPEQRKIAEILSTWDEAIALTEALIAALQRRKQALMQLLLTGQVRFPGFVNSEEYQETEFGSIPTDWDYIQIGQIANSVSNRNTDGDELPVLSCTKYDGLVDSLEYFGRQIYSDDLSTYKLVHHGQFAYATNHIEEGSIGYQDLYDVGLISPMYTVFETTDLIHDPFLYSVLKTELYRHIFEINTSASVDRRGSLRWPQFSKIRIPLPQLGEQQVISDVLDTSEQIISVYTGMLHEFQAQKRGLMQQLLTGAVRV